MSSLGPVSQLRYVLVLNVLAGLVPAIAVKGRLHDPLLNAAWWPHEYHSAVLVVSFAALLGTGLVYLLIRRKVARWWAYSLSGAFVGAVPGVFYTIAMPRPDLARAPEWLALFEAMATVGFVWGALMGLVIFSTVGRRQQTVAGS
jgi:hypothetical protein